MPDRIAPPDKSDYARYFDPYLAWVNEDDLLQAQVDQIEELRAALRPVDETTANVVHAPYQWTIKQVVGHCLDNERIFAARAWRVGSGEGDQQGYDQEALVAATDYELTTLKALIDEFAWLRRANVAMFRRMTDEMLDQSALVGGNSMTPRAMAALQIGHLRYHLDIVRQRLTAAAPDGPGR